MDDRAPGVDEVIPILTCIPIPYDPTSFYRGMGPLGALKRDTRKIELVMPEQVDWTVLSTVSAVFLQRPHSDGHLTIAKQAKDWNVPVWVDYDDDLFSVPPENGAHFAYSDPACQSRMRQILEIADLVTVTTRHLATVVSKWAKRVEVLPNALDDRLLRYRTKQKANNVTLWRGSGTHVKDLMDFADEIVHCADKVTSSKWYFQGYNPWFITERIDPERVMVNRNFAIEHYFKLLHDAVKPNLVMVPLTDNEFNRSKSNIAWIEGAFAGAACLAPNWEEWKRPGVIAYDGNFGMQLQRAITGAWDLEKAADEAWEYITDTLFLSKVNKRRMELIESLL